MALFKIRLLKIGVKGIKHTNVKLKFKYISTSKGPICLRLTEKSMFLRDFVQVYHKFLTVLEKWPSFECQFSFEFAAKSAFISTEIATYWVPS